ncbi:hypothetical protein [Dactylosporangium sp. CA-092794]|uniref:hypothetical protein n=1 Tax=Dactylosporangium sp. CA-092794 TaxID=3239929 RepID=UPI003D8AA429
MHPVVVPTTVGDLRWPVLSAVRVSTAEHPAEFVVLVDCGEPTPREPYATLRVYVWPDRSKAEHGEYNLTFAQAQRSLAERAGLLAHHTVEVVVVRDPDASNDSTVVIDGTVRPHGSTDHVRVITHDIDLGAQDITPDWVAGQLESARRLSPAAAARAAEVIAAYADDTDLDGTGVGDGCGDGA